MADTTSLSTSDLKAILDQIATPGGMKEHPFLKSWIVAEYLEEHPNTANFSTEYLAGQALEHQLELWSEEFPLAEMHHDQWLKIFCLKWFYFQKKPKLAAYQPHPTYKKLGIVIVDTEVLATLVPKREREAEKLLEAEELRAFWYSFGGKVLLSNRAAEKLNGALQAFADQIETRRAHKFSPPIQPSISDDAITVANRETAPTPVNDANKPTESATIVTQPTDERAVASLDLYQQMFDRVYSTVAGYAVPTCRYQSRGTSQKLAGDVAAKHWVENAQSLLLTGAPGIGKTSYLTQVVVTACRQAGLIPLLVPLAEYFDMRSRIENLTGFVREKVAEYWQPDLATQGRFARELAEAVHARRVVWLLDGYDELTTRERSELHRDLDRLERFVLTTRQVQPESGRTIEAKVHLEPIERDDALGFVATNYSPAARARLEAWLQQRYDALRLLDLGLLLDEAAKLAHEPTQALSLTAVLDRAVGRQLSTHARFQARTSVDIHTLARNALSNIAISSLEPQWQLGEKLDRINESDLVTAWRIRTSEPDAIFFQVATSTGLLWKAGDQWQFPSDLIRDELAAEDMQAKGYVARGRTLFPQYERPMSLWAAKLMQADQHLRVIELVNSLRNQSDDLFGARWSSIVKILAECLPFRSEELRRLRVEIEHDLIEFWRGTSSNKMKMQVQLWLFELGSDTVLATPTGGVEYVARDILGALPQIELPRLLWQANFTDLSQGLSSQRRIDQQTVTHALIDILSADDFSLAQQAAIQLTQRNLEPSIMEKLGAAGPIDRLARLAETQPPDHGASPARTKQTRNAQSFALALLARPEILSKESLLKRIPAGVIHTLMADLNLRIRRKADRLSVITADGREWMS